MAILPNDDAAIDFLEKWCPGGPWTVTAIAPNQQGIQTRSFNNQNELRSWLSNFNGKRNIYFNVNPTIEPMDKKASETDLSELRWLHVDVDPRADEDFAEERERIFNLTGSLPQGIPPATVIVDSGGGFQLFWKLKDPVPINGDPTKIDKLKLYNKQFEIVLGGDNCFSLDHIMRLPGTVNIPNKAKIARGRVKVLAKLIRFGTEAYDLHKFKAAPSPQQSPGLKDKVPEQQIKAVRIKDVSHLDKHAQLTIPDWCKVVIVQGKNPEEPDKFESRSEWLFSACCELIRCGVPDEVIYGIITDSNFGISESVLDKKSQAEAYAQRQIRRANEEAINPILRELNEQHAVISDIGGKCRIITEIYDPTLGRYRISRQTFEDFRNRYSNRYVESGDKTIPAGKWWLAHPMRRQFNTIVFAPGREIEGAYNMWRGFAVEAIPGDCELYLSHLQENVCNNREDHYDYLIKWMARAVQIPDTPGETAIVLRGAQGTGKSFMARAFGSLFGRHFVPITDSKHLFGGFNAHLLDCVVLFSDEALYAGDVKHESILKGLVTEETLTTESKGVDAEVTSNFTHIILASNKQWVVPAGSNERRFFVLDVAETYMQNKPYFRKIKQQLDSGGREALLYHLMQIDLSEFEVRTVPDTAALQEQKILSLRSESEWWLNKLMDGRLLRAHTEWTGAVSKDALLDDYLTYAKDIGVTRRSSATALGKFLHRVCPKGYPKGYQQRVGEFRPYFYDFPTLEQCRNSYAQSELGGTYDWPKIPQKPSENHEI